MFSCNAGYALFTIYAADEKFASFYSVCESQWESIRFYMRYFPECSAWTIKKKEGEYQLRILSEQLTVNLLGGLKSFLLFVCSLFVCISAVLIEHWAYFFLTVSLAYSGTYQTNWYVLSVCDVCDVSLSIRIIMNSLNAQNMSKQSVSVVFSSHS